ncbi:hydroxyacid oxidase 1 isoform X2 [Arvicola amphibius]|nr:hydroxyacid oxidase 1 isoform X2 [Arvicola amphibius]
MLRNVADIDLSTSVLGQRVSMPICVGATAMQCMAHVDGELATVRACQTMGTGMMLSSWATSSIEEVAEAGPEALRWMQLYIYKDREVSRQLVKRAEQMGYKAIFVTVDTPYLGNRFDDVRNRFKLPPQLRMKNFETNDLAFSPKRNYGDNSGLAEYVVQAIDPSLSWDDIKWLRRLTSLPIVVKGILRGDDAREAVKHGVDGILVSNHGARQLDGVPATIDALPEIVEAVEGKVEVFLDGGVRKGTDVLKALALGAKAVFVGRPIIWGLAFQGEKGVQDVLEILKEEFRLAMALSGCQNVKVIDKTLKKLSSLNTENVIFHGDTADIWFKSPQFPLCVTSCPHSCLFLSWLGEFFHPATDLCLGPLSFGMAANRNLQNFLCLSLLIFCYLEECGCEINFLLTTGFGHPALRPVRVNPVGLMLLSVLFARYICILAVLFIRLFIWPKP